MPQQQQEALNWGIDIDISSDSDEDMSGTAGGSGGGGAPGGSGGPPRGGGGGAPMGPPAPLPTLNDLTRLMQDVGNAVGLLVQQVLDLTHQQAGWRKKWSQRYNTMPKAMGW
jgi:hypothetical protein